MSENPLHLKLIDPLSYVRARPRERHVGQTLKALNEIPATQQGLIAAINNYVQMGVRYALVGISEDASVRANLGNPGAVNGSNAFMSSFCNLQHHDRQRQDGAQSPALPADEIVDGNEFLIVGKPNLKDLQDRTELLSIASRYGDSDLCKIVASMGERILPILEACAMSDAEITIVEGGGDAWGYECIRAINKATQQKVLVINFDPHADMRDLQSTKPDPEKSGVPERHSGNWMTLALQQELVTQYIPIGLNPRYNNEFIARLLDEHEVPYRLFTRANIRSRKMKNVIRDVLRLINAKYPDSPCFLNFDADSVSGVPVSALNPDGLSMNEAYNAIDRLMAGLPKRPKIFRISELAPKDDAEKLIAGRFAVGLLFR